MRITIVWLSFITCIRPHIYHSLILLTITWRVVYLVSKPTELPIFSNKGGENRRERKALRCTVFLANYKRTNLPLVGSYKRTNAISYSPTRSRLTLKSRRLRSTAFVVSLPSKLQAIVETSGT